MSWIGIVFLYTFGGEILYGIRHDRFTVEEECRSHYESLNNWKFEFNLKRPILFISEI